MVNKRANAGRRLRGKEKRASWDGRNKGRAFIAKEGGFGGMGQMKERRRG